MNYICAYFDTQGFTINTVYHPSEVVMLAKELLIQVKVAKGCDCDPLPEEKKSIKYLSKKHHGLSFYAGGVHPKEVKDLVLTFYKSCRTKDKFLVAVKSKEAEDYLNKYDIPSINIEKDYGATFNRIKTGRVPCNFHANKSDYIRCSLSIVHDMRAFMINYKKK